MLIGISSIAILNIHGVVIIIIRINKSETINLWEHALSKKVDHDKVNLFSCIKKRIKEL